MKANIPVNEIVSLLEDYLPNELVKLRQNFPNQRSILSSGQILGETNTDELKLKMELSLSGLKAILQQCKEKIPKIKSRLKNISRLQFVSQLMVLISGATIISILQEGELLWVKYVSSILVLIGSIVNLYTQHISNSAYNEKSMINIYESLTEHYIEAEQLQKDLEFYNRLESLEDKEDEVVEIINSVNEASLELKKVLINI